MARSCFLGVTVLAVALLATQFQAAFSQTPASDMTCKVYPLSELGDDPNLCKWIADTIPEVIQPGTWAQSDGTEARRRISYYAPSKILVVYHNAAVHAKVDAFLRDLKKAMPQETTAVSSRPRSDHQVVPAQYTGPSLIQSSGAAAPPTSAYPVPAQTKQPKHLFHFIIRYEGEGLIDANVVKFTRALNAQDASRGSAAPVTSCPSAPVTASPPPTVTPGGSYSPALTPSDSTRGVPEAAPPTGGLSAPPSEVKKDREPLRDTGPSSSLPKQSPSPSLVPQPPSSPPIPPYSTAPAVNPR
jgi:hypothetical protein